MNTGNANGNIINFQELDVDKVVSTLKDTNEDLNQGFIQGEDIVVTNDEIIEDINICKEIGENLNDEKQAEMTASSEMQKTVKNPLYLQSLGKRELESLSMKDKKMMKRLSYNQLFENLMAIQDKVDSKFILKIKEKKNRRRTMSLKQPRIIVEITGSK